MQKVIYIPKDFFKDLKFNITMPMITCKFCGKEILATPENIYNFGI